MNSFFTKVSIVGILMGCISYTQAMENRQNGLEMQETQDKNDFKTLCPIFAKHSASGGGPFEGVPLFTLSNATRAEVMRYPVLNYFGQGNCIEANQPVNYYLDRMQELIDSIMQFRKDVKDYKDGLYKNYKQHKVTQQQMQDIFATVWCEIINKSLRAPNRNSKVDQELRKFREEQKHTISTRALKCQDCELQHLCGYFKYILCGK